jgi:hypothetical protein
MTQSGHHSGFKLAAFFRPASIVVVAILLVKLMSQVTPSLSHLQQPRSIGWVGQAVRQGHAFLSVAAILIT